MDKLRPHIRTSTLWAGAGLILYLSVSYLLLPDIWRHYEHRPELAGYPKTTFTTEGVPGDPLNVGLIGTAEKIIQAARSAGWVPADPLRFSSDLKIAESVVLRRPYPTAPVSRLYLFGRPQDLALEKEVGPSARQRHHVRLWRTPISDNRGQPLWIGSATFDRSVGLSHATGQFTHHIDPDIDQERDRFILNLSQTGWLQAIYQVSGLGPTLNGRNGSRDRYYTDGEISIGVLFDRALTIPSVVRSNPLKVELKNRSWNLIKTLLE